MGTFLSHRMICRVVGNIENHVIAFDLLFLFADVGGGGTIYQLSDGTTIVTTCGQ